MDDSFEDLFSDDEIDLTEIEYKPKKEIKNDAKTMDKQIKLMDKHMGKRCSKKPQFTEEEIIDKRRMILLIQFYLLEFPDKLKSFKKINLEKKNFSELSDIKREIDFTVSNRSTIKQGVQILSTGIQTLEFMLLNFTPINCTGLSNICNDPDTLDDMKHICLKHTHLINTEPEARLMYKILTTTMMLHNINTSIPKENNEIIRKINTEYADL